MKYLRAASPEVGPAVVEGGQHVEGDGEDLEAQEDDDQVVGRAHQHGPRRRDHGQDVELRALDPLAPQVAVGHQGGEQHGDGDQDRMKHAKPSMATARAMVVWARGGHVGPLARGRPQGGEGDGDGAVVATVTRRGRRTSEETARRRTAPPSMIIIGQDGPVADVRRVDGGAGAWRVFTRALPAAAGAAGTPVARPRRPPRRAGRSAGSACRWPSPPGPSGG